MHHPKADKEYFYIYRENGGRGVENGAEVTYNTTIIVLKKYLDTTYWMLQLVNTHRKQKKSIYSVSNKFADQLDLTPKEIDMKK